ncbi:hypothetical protein MMC28_009296 [Mycoblastus sanguinarius]|nr:hypothetical protein [Mycoblastus sanguinarius]
MEEDRGPILTLNVLTFGIITFFLAVALISSLAQDAFNVAPVTQWGYGQHKKDLSVAVRSSPAPLKLLWLNQIFFKLTTMLTKLSICLIYYNMFKRANSGLIRATRMATCGTALLIFCYYMAAFFVSVFECTPVPKSWHSKESGTCINMNKFRLSTAAVNIITSVLVIAIPLPALSKMRHTRPEITELMGLILLGVV